MDQSVYTMNALSPLPQKNAAAIVKWFDLLRDSQRIRLSIAERRNSERIPYPFPVFLTPYGSEGELSTEESFGVIGRQISQKGFDFFHREPIADKLVVASFEYSPDRWLAMKLKLTWCRFGRHGYFENGGEFLCAVDSPLGVGPIDGYSS